MCKNENGKKMKDSLSKTKDMVVKIGTEKEEDISENWKQGTFKEPRNANT